MQVGDLVQIKGTSIVALVTRIATADNYYKSVTRPTEWVFLSGQDLPRSPHTLEVINESR